MAIASRLDVPAKLATRVRMYSTGHGTLPIVNASLSPAREAALDQGFVIVSKDEDFHQRALVSGPPPKVIWVRFGNCTTSDIEQAIHGGHDTIMTLLEDETASFLTLG